MSAIPHQPDLFRFCPRCGQRRFDPVSVKSYRCGACDFMFYMNTAAACAAIIEDADGRILLTRRLKNPALGKWDLPGGFIDNDETGEQGIMRELAEEIGLDEGTPEYLFSFPNHYLYRDVLYYTLDLFYRVRVAQPERLEARDEVDALHFFPRNQIPFDELSFASITRGLRHYLDLPRAGCD